MKIGRFHSFLCMTTVLAPRVPRASSLHCVPATAGLRGGPSPVLLLKALSTVPRNLRGPHFALLLLLLLLLLHTVNFLSNNPLSLSVLQQRMICYFSSSPEHDLIFFPPHPGCSFFMFKKKMPRLFLHEATMRLMAGAPPAKTQQLLER